MSKHTKEQIINKVLIDLPAPEMRSEMSNQEWYGWFADAYDKGFEQSLRDKIESLRTWIIVNTEDVEGQDGVKWNCIERDELLEYLNNQTKQQ